MTCFGVNQFTCSLFGATVFDNFAAVGLANDPYLPTPVPILKNGIELSASIADFGIQISDATTGLFGPGAFLDESLDLNDFAVKFVNFQISEDPNGINLLTFQAGLTSFRLEGDPLPDPKQMSLPPTVFSLLLGLGAIAHVRRGRRQSRSVL